MEAHHAMNPWSVQQPRPRKQTSFHDTPPESPRMQEPLKRDQNLDDYFPDHKEVFFHAQQQQQQLQQLQHLRQLQQQLEQAHNLQFGRVNNDEKDDLNEQKESSSSSSSEDDGEETADTTETESLDTAWSSSNLGIDSPLNDSSSTLADSMTVITFVDSDLGDDEGEEVLQELVHQLKTEVQDSRATVYDLESRLSMAEHSSRNIVEELKLLLAEEGLGAMTSKKGEGDDRTNRGHAPIAQIDKHAEHTLASDNGDSFALSSRRIFDNGEAEDSNAAYNRICLALQSLIDEAQLALERTTTAKLGSTTLSETSCTSTLSAPLAPSQPSQPTNLDQTSMSSSSSSSTLPTLSSMRNSTLVPVPRDLEAHNLILEPRSVRRNSLLENNRPTASTYMLATSTYGGTDDVSKMLWRQKHEEQHDRYRRSSQRLTLELEREFLQSPITTDSEDSEDSQLAWSSLPRSRISRASELSSSTSSPATSVPSSPTTPKALQGILRTSQRSGLKTERMKKKLQVQFLTSDIESSDNRRHREELSTSPLSTASSSSASSVSTSASKITPSTTATPSSSSSTRRSQKHEEPIYQQNKKQELPSRQYTHRSVGSQSVAAKRSTRGTILQLYELWQNTWLRTRIMHVITGSVEVVIIIWVVIRASRATLSWLGIAPAITNNVGEWLSLIYGSRASAGFSAKDIYAKILKDGVQMRRLKPLPEALVGDLVAGAVTSSSLLSPSKVVYGPAKRVMGHAATGVVLAYLSDGARRLIRKM
ncbi:hypothetical protein BGZ83_006867 [Gryganskiella cystojenkinii]|nr:hypothetical protein BGZ83_006867 [Gryganskiella cystojenkinii]